MFKSEESLDSFLKSVSDKISIRALDVHHIKIDNALMIAGIKAIQNTMLKSKEIKSYYSTIQSGKKNREKDSQSFDFNDYQAIGRIHVPRFCFALLNDDMYAEK